MFPLASLPPQPRMPRPHPRTSRVRLSKRAVPGFLRQFWWCLGRAVLQRSRDPVGMLVDAVIIAVTGMTLGLLSDRGRETIMHYAVSTTYSVVAVGLMASVGGLGTFGTRRLVAQREAAAGLNRLAHFLALDCVDAALALMHSAVYLVMWYSFAVPRAVVWQMYAVTAATVYACTGTAYLLSQASRRPCSLWRGVGGWVGVKREDGEEARGEGGWGEGWRACQGAACHPCGEPSGWPRFASLLAQGSDAHTSRACVSPRGVDSCSPPSRVWLFTLP